VLPSPIGVNPMATDPNCSLLQDRRRQIPDRKVHEDDAPARFPRHHPWAPVHVLVIPQIAPFVRWSTSAVESRALLGRMMVSGLPH
jgi:histidine triad (HIT) family protein